MCFKFIFIFIQHIYFRRLNVTWKFKVKQRLQRLALAASLTSAAVGVSDLLQEPASCYEWLLHTAWQGQNTVYWGLGPSSWYRPKTRQSARPPAYGCPSVTSISLNDLFFYFSPLPYRLPAPSVCAFKLHRSSPMPIDRTKRKTS